MNNPALVHWCRATALPVLEAAAAGQPVGYAAERALRGLRELLAKAEPMEREAMRRLHGAPAAVDDRPGKTANGGSAAMERRIDALRHAADGYA
jgi:hypothetical protein